ncbi:hypothetical protein CTI12_AA446680 [Artemisia annua]|uniref:Helitron helicase-like domain-containing protein n=1 Tax=Artemisia annua TaxID=35608 RepID=A0A2U1LWF5_ARTAN|nr:hypothetical protein CTI12_AA446680 [Artemisia annua]
MAIPNEDDSGYTTEIIKVEYEWTPPHCDVCNVFGHDRINCPKCVKETVRSDNHVAAEAFTTLEKTNDGFIEVKNPSGMPAVASSSKSKSGNGGSRRVPIRRQRARTAIVRIYSLGVAKLLAFLYLPSFTINYSIAIGNQHRVDSNELPTQGPIAPPQREGAPTDYKYLVDVIKCVITVMLFFGWKKSEPDCQYRQHRSMQNVVQMYIYDTAHEVQHRLSHFEAHERQALREDIIEGLIQFLDDNNALVQLFRTARDKLLEANIPNFQIRLFGVPGSNQYELPTADTIGAIVYEGGPESITDYDVVIEQVGFYRMQGIRARVLWKILEAHLWPFIHQSHHNVIILSNFGHMIKSYPLSTSLRPIRGLQFAT